MPKYPDPPFFDVARAIRDLLEDSGLSLSDQNDALSLARYFMPPRAPVLLNTDAANPDAITTLTPDGRADG